MLKPCRPQGPYTLLHGIMLMIFSVQISPTGRTCVGVRDMTKEREMERQSPLPNLARPSRNRRCSSSVQGMPLRRSCSLVRPFCGACAHAHDLSK